MPVTCPICRAKREISHAARPDLHPKFACATNDAAGTDASESIDKSLRRRFVILDEQNGCLVVLALLMRFEDGMRSRGIPAAKTLCGSDERRLQLKLKRRRN